MSPEARRCGFLWTGILTASVLLSSSPAGAQTLSGGVDVNVSATPEDQYECAISKNPRNESQLFVFCNNEPNDNGLYAAHSSDGGMTWARTMIEPAGACDPTLAWDGFENLYLSYINGHDYDVIVILLSTDGGATFSKLREFPKASVDQPTIVATRTPEGPGAVWIAWNQGGQMVATGAAVTGRGLRNIGDFGKLQWIPGTENNCSVGDIAIAANGVVVQACQQPIPHEGRSTVPETDLPSRILVNIDPDGLGPHNFGDAKEVTKTNVGDFDRIPAQSNFGVDAEVGLAFENNPTSPPGRLYLVYTDETAVDNDDMDIEVRFSDDNGETWPNGPIRVNDDRTNRSQFLPKIAADVTSGNIMVCWYDCRNSPDNSEMQVYCAQASSADTPPTFGPNAMISDTASKSNGAGFEFGDYSGLDYAGGAAHPVWAGIPRGRVKKGEDTPDFDAFTDRVTPTKQVGQKGKLLPGRPSRVPARRPSRLVSGHPSGR